MDQQLIAAIKENKAEVNRLIADKPNWQIAFDRFDNLYQCMSNPADSVWGRKQFETFKKTYYNQREKDKGMSNIVTRTVTALPVAMRNTAKMMFLQMAEACCLFNASHKVNFEQQELPEGHSATPMQPAKTKGMYTYASPTPALYPKTSLTFDYWVPKLLEWTEEIRSKGLRDWKGDNILQHESCTDLMRVCLMFLSNREKNVPIAKAADRQAMLALLNSEFVWIKKAAKREDIAGNNTRLAMGLTDLNKQTGIAIPLEAWSRLQHAPFIKPIIKTI